MANIVTGNYNTETLKTPKVQDYGSIYAAIGNALNQKYYQNRQAYINNIVNPLSQIKATSRGQKVLNSERAKIIEGANQFKEQDNWFAADDYIFNTTESIRNNEGLKAVQADYALQQQFNEELDKSDWDQRSKLAIKLQANLQSDEIVYDADTNTVISGGFNPVPIGKPFDVQKYQKDIYDILSKAKADSTSWEKLITDPKMISQYGLDTITGLDGEEIVQGFIKTHGKTEQITYNEIYNYAMSLLASNPEYQSHLRTVWQHNDILNRYVKDDSVKGGHLRDYELSDYAPLFGNNPIPYVFEGLGINLNSLGAFQDGVWVTSKNLSSAQKDYINEINNRFGVNIIDVLENKVSLPADIIQNGLSKYIDIGFNNYAKGVLGSTGDVEQIDRTVWTQGLLSNQFIANQMKGIASSAAGLYSTTKTDYGIDFIANPAYTAVVKAKAKSAEAEVEAINRNAPYLDVISGFEVTKDSVADNVEKQDQLISEMTRLQNSMNQMFSVKELNTIGLNPGDGDMIRTLNYGTVSKLVDNSDMPQEEKDILKGKLLEVQTKTLQYNNLKAQYDQTQIQMNSVFDIYEKYRDKIEGGIGWYRVNNDYAKIILNNRIRNYDEFMDYIDTNYEELYDRYSGDTFYRVKDKESGNPMVLHGMLTREGFNRTISNAMDNVSNRYRKSISDKPLEFTAVRDVIMNPGKFTQDYLDMSKAVWKNGNGDLVVTQTQTGKGIGLTKYDLAPLIDLNVFPQSTTVNRNGISVTTQNTPNKNTVPISGEMFGYDWDIYRTEIRPVANGVANKNGKLEYQIVLFDKSNTARGHILAESSANREIIGRQMVDNYRRMAPAANIGGEIVQRSIGSLAAQYSDAMIDFQPANPSVPNAGNFAQIVENLDNLERSRELSNSTEPIELEYNMIILDPLRGEPEINYDGTIGGNSRRVRIGKNNNGYYVRDVEGVELPDGSKHLGLFGYADNPNSLMYIESMIPMNGSSVSKTYNTIQEAFAPIGNYILSQYGQRLDYMDAVQSNNIKNVNSNTQRY